MAEASEDEPEFREEALAELRRHYDWLGRERDPDGDGLITILFPDESGLDDSPKYDDVYGWMAHHLPGYFWLVRALAAAGLRRPRDRRPLPGARRGRAGQRGLRARPALALAADRATTPRRSIYAARAERTERALVERCWDEQAGLFFDLAGPDELQVPVSTWASLAPLALPGLPEDVRRRLVEDHLLHPRRYRTHTGIPSVALEEATFNPDFDRFRCWRGPPGCPPPGSSCRRCASSATRRMPSGSSSSLAEAVERDGFREYYNPLTGKGLAAKRFGMSTLLVELLHP